MFGNPQTLQEIGNVAKRLSGKGGKAQFEAMKELLGPEQANRVRAIAEAADAASKVEGKGSALSLAIGARQVGAFETVASGGALTSLFTGNPEIALYSAGILLAPAFLAKVATSKSATNRVIKMLSSQRPLPARMAEQVLTRMVYELGIDPEDFEGSMIEPNTLAGRLQDLQERTEARGQMRR